MSRLWTRIQAHAEACRPDTLFYAGTVGLSGAVLTDVDAPPRLLLLAWLVPTLAWIASIYGGDYFDRDLDRLTKPHRPIPSGRVRAETARAVMVGGIGAGGLIAVLVNPLTAGLAGVACAFGIAYASVLKGRGLWGNVVRGLPTALTLLWGSMVVQPLPEPRLLPLAVVFWLHDSGSNLLGALGDRDGDRRGGCRTYPVRQGDQATVRGLVNFLVSWVALGALWPLVLGGGISLPVYYAGLAVVALANWMSVALVARAPRPIPRAVCLRAHEIVVAARIVLGTFLLAAAGRPDVALLVGGTSLVVTLVARALMRRRYEPVRA
ncbi:(S)-2,3-di-O-geranylgeranylglyceryl phosphate synthase [Alloactinosynnema sp. L-07]|uniref:UbiA family prenyltransferase n=1 Tax=Alloactinosynnema sp. L-07 TaxID=1653480 RepID=UPI00065EF280|nr:UbiA family prenyltransferase [Alloactinosynnema sp. L-07]CRK61972.1 (S)-2,3-di-O-geranylgeranylglyceryl phosphate synthase [Alloactinosynnema sp. L-07]